VGVKAMQIVDERRGVFHHENHPSVYFTLLEKKSRNHFGLEWKLIKLCTESGGKVKDNHNYHLCVLCGKKIRSSEDLNTNLENFRAHKHPKSKTPSIQSKIDKFVSHTDKNTPESENLLILFCKFICGTRISLVQASSNFFYELVYAAMRLARKYMDIPVEKLFKKYTRQSLSDSINFFGSRVKKRLLRMFRNQKVSIVLDGATCLLFCFLLFIIFFFFFFF
jgi:hypothetical protein